MQAKKKQKQMNNAAGSKRGLTRPSTITLPAKTQPVTSLLELSYRASEVLIRRS